MKKNHGCPDEYLDKYETFETKAVFMKCKYVVNLSDTSLSLNSFCIFHLTLWLNDSVVVKHKLSHIINIIVLLHAVVSDIAK